MQIEINSVVDGFPTPDDLSDECNEYYLVYMGNYGWTKAMYCRDDDGKLNWYRDYTSKIRIYVTHWAKLPNPNF